MENDISEGRVKVNINSVHDEYALQPRENGKMVLLPTTLTHEGQDSQIYPIDKDRLL